MELPPLPLRTLPPHRTLRVRFERWEQVPEQALSGVEYLILPIAQADRVPREWREKTLLELPRVMFGALEEEDVYKRQHRTRAERLPPSRPRS